MNLSVVEYKNPIYTHTEKYINCEINHPDFGWIPFTASPHDPEKHGRDIYQRIIKDGNIAPYIPPPPPSQAELESDARYNRDQLLQESDWTQLPDVPESIKSKWAAYRQLLRDVPQQENFPENIIWPQKP
jgi:hypothetical protein